MPANIFSEVTRTGLDDPQLFAGALEDLFRAMASGGRFGRHKIRHFNGHLFEEATVFELTEDELRQLAEAAEADWQFIEPSIMGTLFERALEPEQRSQLGAHYTSEPDIKTLVEPVLSPWQNGFVESFHARFRDECLNQEQLWTLTEARVVIEDFRCHYNERRPHSKLGYKSPACFAALQALLTPASCVEAGQHHPSQLQTTQPQD